MQKKSLHLSSHHRGLCVISLSSKRESLVQGAKGPMEELQAQLDSKRMTAASTAKAAEKASGAERIALLGLQNTQESQVLALEQRLNLLIKGEWRLDARCLCA